MEMKKIIITIISMTLFLSSVTGFASTDFNLKGHWAENIIDKQFVEAHFNYLIKEDAKALNLDGTIDKKDFLLSLYTILYNQSTDSSIGKNDTIVGRDKEDKNKTDDHKIKIDNAVKYLKSKNILEKDSTIEGKITRKETVYYIIKTLELSREIQLANTDYLPFKDILGVDEGYKKSISKANMIGIVKGYGNGTFRPEEDTTVVEAIVFLQRIKGELDERDRNIPFKVIEEKWSNRSTNNFITTKQSSGKVKVTVTKEFPTSGYTMTVNRVEKYANGKYRVYLDIKVPATNTILLQVISYRTITIEIDRNMLDSGSYTFEIANSTLKLK